MSTSLPLNTTITFGELLTSVYGKEVTHIPCTNDFISPATAINVKDDTPQYTSTTICEPLVVAITLESPQATQVHLKLTEIQFFKDSVRATFCGELMLGAMSFRVASLCAWDSALTLYMNITAISSQVLLAHGLIPTQRMNLLCKHFVQHTSQELLGFGGTWNYDSESNTFIAQSIGASLSSCKVKLQISMPQKDIYCKDWQIQYFDKKFSVTSDRESETGKWITIYYPHYIFFESAALARKYVGNTAIPVGYSEGSEIKMIPSNWSQCTAEGEEEVLNILQVHSVRVAEP